MVQLPINRQCLGNEFGGTCTNRTNADTVWWRIHIYATPGSSVLKCVTIGTYNGPLFISGCPLFRPLLIYVMLQKLYETVSRNIHPPTRYISRKCSIVAFDDRCSRGNHRSFAQSINLEEILKNRHVTANRALKFTLFYFVLICILYELSFVFYVNCHILLVYRGNYVSHLWTFTSKNGFLCISCILCVLKLCVYTGQQGRTASGWMFYPV